ncbi:MAG TPA: CPBP family intramembrane glutamic endopeptidase [Opitutaceae bacterium]|nr:CPBP family intramembrane glutamic endopeptidase [Opitutaceae bacterium]
MRVHLLALLVLLPALADRWVFAPFGRGARARLGVYVRIVAWQWVASAAILLCIGARTVWFAPSDAAALPWLPPAWAADLAAAAFVAAVVWPVLRRRPRPRSDARAFGPSHRAEPAVWALVALTSGVCEEVMFRGFLLGYLHVFPWHWGWLPALGISSLAFGLGHLYQGGGACLRAAAAGLLFCGLYLASGSLLLPVAAHVAGDLAGLLPSLRRSNR